METMHEYVARKLKETYINRVGVVEKTGLSRDAVDRAARINSHATARTIQRLHDFFRKINE